MQRRVAADSSDTNPNQKVEQTSVSGLYADKPKDAKDTTLAPAKATKAA